MNHDILSHLVIIWELFLQQTGPLLHACGDGIGLLITSLLVITATDVIIT